MATRSCSSILTIIYALFAFGCSGDDPVEPPPPTAKGCEVDANLVAAAPACVAHESCPCGSYCELGRCIADCDSDAACGAGERCDSFGLCRDAEDTASTPSPRPEDTGRLSVSPTTLEVYDGSARELGVSATRKALGRTRVAADDGLMVSCDNQASFDAECFFDAVPLEGGVSVWVRPSEPLAATPQFVRVFSGAQRKSVSVSSDQAVVGTGAVEGPLEGAYTGQAVLQTTEISADPLAAGQPVGLAPTIEVRASVFAAADTGAAVLELNDVSRILAGTASWVAPLTVDANGTDGSIDFPTNLYFTGSAAFGAPVELMIEAPPAAVKISNEGARSISFSLLTRQVGSFRAGQAVQNRYTVTLYRRGDLPPGSTEPALVPDAVATLDPERSIRAEGWERAVNQALQSVVSNPELLFGRNDTVWSTYTGQGSNFLACAQADDPTELYLQAWLRPLLGSPLRFLGESTGINYGVVGDYFPGNEFRVLATSTTTSPLFRLFAADLDLTPSFVAAGILTEGQAEHQNLRVTPGDYGGALPCAFDANGSELTYTAQTVGGACGQLFFPASFNLSRSVPVDVCQDMAQSYGCEVIESAPGDQDVVGFFVDQGFFNANNVCRFEIDQDLVLNVQRRCIFPSESRPQLLAHSCGELALCYDPASVTPDAGIGESARLGPTVDAVTGELLCAGTGASVALPVDQNATGMTSPEMLRACLDDLDDAQDDLSAETIGQIWANTNCVNAIRLLYSASSALEPARVRAGNPAFPLRADEEALALRLLQRYVQLQAFVARQSQQAERFAEVIRRVDSNDPSLPPAPDEVLRRSLAGWSVLLHPRFADAIRHVDPAVLAAPDYREFVAPGFVDSQTVGRSQGEGLAVAMIEALTAQLELSLLRLERAQRTSNQEPLVLYNEVRATVFRMLPYAQDIHTRASAWAEANNQSLAWDGRYRLALDRLDILLAKAKNAAERLQSEANPLGIEDDDLPLYFFADTVGAGGRFSAISDFLLGESPASPSNFAPFAVAQAREAFADARQAWVDFTNRQTARAQSAAELSERIEELHLRFAGELTGYCGTPGQLDTTEVLEGWQGAHGRPFAADDCFYDFAEPNCDFRLGEWAQLMSTDDVLYQYCVASELESRLGRGAASVNGINDEANRNLLNNIVACSTTSQFPVACPNGEVSCLDCPAAGGLVSIDPRTLAALYNGAPSAVIGAARSECLRQFPGAKPEVPGIEETGAPALENPRCYRGSLGQAVLTTRAIATDVEIARSEFDEFQERYDIAMSSCLVLKAGNDALEAAQASHNESMSALRAGKLAADIVAEAARGVKDCADSVGPEDAGGGATAAVACGAGAVETAANAVSAGLQFAMDEAQQKHEAVLMQLGGDIAEDQCFNDAEMELVGTRTAALRIQRAISDLQSAVFEVDTLKILAATAYADGRAAVAAAKDRSVAPLDHDYWFDEKLERFVRRQRIATRIAYLTVRAVEYEYQQSLSARAEVLAAETPDELEASLDELWTTAGTRRINGNAPTDLKVVVSMKRNLLQLGDNSEQPAGYNQLSDTERLRLRLTDPRYEVYDDAGTFLGRQIPFNLAPLQALGLGATQGISVFANNSCAERLWSVNATIQGDADKVFVGDDPAFIDVQLLKSNTFYSQWCSSGGTEMFQEASVRPSRNLFADPGAGSLVGEQLGLGNETSSYSRARMQAFFNVERDEFSKDDFANGDSSELAGRGLYGQYAIFFPAGVLKQGSGDGLDLNAIDDVLLRLDYVSVAR